MAAGGVIGDRTGAAVILGEWRVWKAAFPGSLVLRPGMTADHKNRKSKHEHIACIDALNRYCTYYGCTAVHVQWVDGWMGVSVLAYPQWPSCFVQSGCRVPRSKILLVSISAGAVRTAVLLYMDEWVGEWVSGLWMGGCG